MTSRERFDAWVGRQYEGHYLTDWEIAELWAVWQAAESTERERCKLIVQRNQYRSGHDYEAGKTIGRFDMAMIAQIDDANIS